MTAPGPSPPAVRCDVLIVGAGAAGMYAAISAAQHGADVLVIDKSIVGRGGATVMAMMTVAAALESEEPDDWTIHRSDTLAAGRGLCDTRLAALLCEEAPRHILEMDRWGVGWARRNGRIHQVIAPGHTRKRCVYVDVLNTGPSIASTLQGRLYKEPRARRISNVAILDLMLEGGRCVGAVGWDLVRDRLVRCFARAVVLAGGGLTRVYQRNSASLNMTGDSHAMALRAGATLIDMEFVQFFPIAHLAPRMVGLDPIMWDPFRYKLGGRLLNGCHDEFLHRYGTPDDGHYVATRDLASYAILKEVEAGRGSPHGGAYLDFRHIPDDRLVDAFGPVIARLRQNGIDLRTMCVEVSPTAHYHMGGVQCDATMATSVPGLFAAGEAVGGAHGANRLSGNAIPEAFVFGARAGAFAARHAGVTTARLTAPPATPFEESIHQRRAPPRTSTSVTAQHLIAQLQECMTTYVGPLRTAGGLSKGRARIEELREELWSIMPAPDTTIMNIDRQDWFDLRNMLDAAEAIAAAALERQETRGAHVRLDHPDADPRPTRLAVSRRGSTLRVDRLPVSHVA